MPRWQCSCGIHNAAAIAHCRGCGLHWRQGWRGRSPRQEASSRASPRRGASPRRPGAAPPGLPRPPSPTPR
eukprot:8791645-Pyramimonas_sp.AAC.1